METMTNETQSPRLLNERTMVQWMAYSLYGNGIIPPDAGFYAIALDFIARGENEFQASNIYDQWADQLECECKRYGIEDQPDWERLPFAPMEIRDLLNDFKGLQDDAIVKVMERYEEREMSALYRDNRAEFDRRFEAGRAYFQTSEEE